MSERSAPAVLKGYNVEFLQTVYDLNNDIQSQFQVNRENKYALLQLEPGLTVLDAGCGPGTDTIRFAELVAPGGHVVGIDSDEEMIAEANKKAKEAELKSRIEHHVLDVCNLPFEDNYFDRCHSERLFIHLTDPQSALAGIIRVMKSGGWIVASDPDFIGISIDTSEIDIERRLVKFKADTLANGYAARQSYRLFKQNSLADVTVMVQPIQITDLATRRYLARSSYVNKLAVESGVVSQAELDRYNADLEERDRTGAFFAHGNVVVVVGRKK